MRLREIKKLLVSLADPRPPQSTGAKGHQRMDNLITRICRVLPRVEKTDDPFERIIRLMHKINNNWKNRQRPQRQVPYADTAHKKHDPCQRAQDDNGSKIRLHGNQEDKHAENYHMGKKPD